MCEYTQRGIEMSFNLSSITKLLVLGAIVGTLSGCATNPCCEAKLVTPIITPTDSCGTASTCSQRSAVMTPTKLSAVGYGAPGAYTQYTHGQQKLMAMRAAQVDAYRNLAEQVYGFRVWGSTAVSAFATQNDNIRTYVDAFIRGAKVVNMTSIADGNFEATVELEITADFYNCLNKQNSCSVRAAIPSCAGSGCSAPSVTYFSN